MHTRLITGQHCHPRTGHGCAQQCAGFVGADVALHGHRHRLAVLLEMPEAFAEVGVGQAVVLAQVLDPLRCRVFAQVSRGGADHRAADGQPPGDQVRVKVVAGADRQVDAFIHQVHRAVEHLHVDADTGVPFDVSRHGIRQLRLAERGADADAQQATWRLVRLADSGLHVGGQVEHLPTPGQNLAAGGGQAQFARGAVHQTCADPVFQLGQITRYHRPRQVQMIGGGRLAAEVDH